MEGFLWEKLLLSVANWDLEMVSYFAQDEEVKYNNIIIRKILENEYNHIFTYL